MVIARLAAAENAGAGGGAGDDTRWLAWGPTAAEAARIGGGVGDGTLPSSGMLECRPPETILADDPLICNVRASQRNVTVTLLKTLIIK